MSDWPDVDGRNETSTLRSAVLTYHLDRLSSGDGHRRRHRNNGPPKDDRRQPASRSTVHGHMHGLIW